MNDQTPPPNTDHFEKLRQSAYGQIAAEMLKLIEEERKNSTLENQKRVEEFGQFIIVAERNVLLPESHQASSTMEQQLTDGRLDTTLPKFITIMTGFKGFDESNQPQWDDSQIVSELQKELLRNKTAQSFLNDRMCRLYGVEFDLASIVTASDMSQALLAEQLSCQDRENVR